MRHTLNRRLWDFGAKRRRSAQRGFTLVELLVVITIIALIMGIVGPRVLGYLSESKAKAAKIQIESFASALDLYYLDTGRYPAGSEGLAALVRKPGNVSTWNGPYLKGGVVPPEVFLFTREVEHPGSTVHSRMFAPGLGITEDPATGGASGPLGCYLVRHGLVACDTSARIVSEQGIEMGRPSFIKIRIERDGDRITAVKVGGQCHFMGEGFIEI